MNPEILGAMQQFVFDTLDYTELSRSQEMPLINMNLGDTVEAAMPEVFAHQKITLHRSLTEIDLLCSMPMMKTHVLATVTVGMKNLIGLHPGIIYKTVRAGVHDHCSDAGSSGIDFETLTW